MSKRFFDIVSSLFGLIFLSPLFLAIFILIKIKMPGGPVLFRQNRIGQFGKLFKIYKFRSMQLNHNGNTISVKGENRITPFGAVLRKYKLDELPELWNVLKGDMSFVGPRPDVEGYADKLKDPERILLSVKPGITGPATLKFSNEEELLSSQLDPVRYNKEVLYPKKVKINLKYIEHWSFWLDIKIIVFTLVGKKLMEPWFN